MSLHYLQERQHSQEVAQGNVMPVRLPVMLPKQGRQQDAPAGKGELQICSIFLQES